MTAVARAVPVQAAGGGWFGVAFRFAMRDLRGGIRGFSIFLAAIALGVAAIAGIGAIARGMTDGIADQGREILGGDIAFSIIQRQAAIDERAWLDRLGTVSEVATLRAMARRADGSDQALVEVKAIDAAYPLYGAVTLAGGGDVHALLGDTDGFFGAVAEPELATRLDLKPGDRFTLGDATFVLRGIIASEPDRLAGGLAFGPRVMVSAEGLAATGLVQPGSLITWLYRARLAGAPDGAAVAKISDAAAAAFPHAGWQVRTRDDAAPGLRRNIDRFAEFLSLIAFTALIVGGVGVTNAVAAFLDGKRDSIATMKCLGAPARTAVAVYFIEITVLAGLGIVIGLAVGALMPFLADAALAGILPVEVGGLRPGALVLAAADGLVTALAFSLIPLGRAGAVPPTALFRDEVMPAPARAPLGYLLGAIAGGAILAALAIGFAFDRRIAVLFVGAAAAAFLLLRAVAIGIVFLARRAPRRHSVALRLALGNMSRPGALTPSLVLSLGLALTLVVALVLIDGNFRRELLDSVPKDAPSFYFLDIRPTELGGFRAAIERETPGAVLELQPNLRGRIVAVAGVPVDKVKADSNARWVLEGDRGLTYAATEPAHAVVAAGTWWPADYAGPPLVSFDGEIAEGLHLKLGDSITVNVLGRDVTAIVANFRTIDWQSLGINTVMIFSPNAFRGAPFTYIATAAFPDGIGEERESALLKSLAHGYPGIAAIRVGDVIDAVDRLVGQIGWAVRGVSAITLIASALVLGGAFAAGRRQRVHDAVVLKTLGATRLRLTAAYALEFILVAAATSLFAIVAGAAAAWLILSRIMDIDFVFLPFPPLAAALLALLVTLVLGLAGTWRVLGEKAAPILRNL